LKPFPHLIVRLKQPGFCVNNYIEEAMLDSRIEELAQVLVKYSVRLQRGDEFCLETCLLADGIGLSVIKGRDPGRSKWFLFRQSGGS